MNNAQLTIKTLALFAGKTREYPDHEPSAIAKQSLTASTRLTNLGFASDEQYEKRFHGGIDRALCHYPYEHYEYWQTKYPQSAPLFIAPAFGENISTTGLTEENAFMGDIYQLGEAIIQITQPRSPCYKLNFHLNVPDFSAQMQASTCCGWLYRVIKEGDVSPHSQLKLLTRPGNISVKEALNIAFNEPFDIDRTIVLMSSPGLSTSWVRTMQTRLITQKIESFDPRLFKTVTPK